MTDQPTDIETAALNNPAVTAGLEAANEGRTKKRGRPASIPNQTAERGPRFNPKLNDEAQRALTDLATLNGLGFAPTVAEITVGATDYAAEMASRWVVQQYQKATAGLKKLEAQ